MTPPMFPKAVAAGLISFPQQKSKKKPSTDADTLRRIHADRKRGMGYKELSQKYGVSLSRAHQLCLEELP